VTPNRLRIERFLIVGLLAAVAMVFGAINAGFPEEMLAAAGIDTGHHIMWQVAQAGYWSCLSFTALAIWRFALVATPSPTAPLLSTAALAALFQIALLVGAGMVFGFGRSPYATGLTDIFANLLYVGAVLVAVETARATVVVVIARTNPVAAIAIGTLVFAMIRVPLTRLVSLSGGEAAFSFLGGDLLPSLAVGLVASVLAASGGPLPAIVYGGLLQAFEWLSPILPDLDWAVAAFVGTLGPVLVLSLLQQSEARATGEEAESRQRSGVAGAIALVAAVWLVGGLFGVRPVAVSGPSMAPTYNVGDLVVVQEVAAPDIVAGDVVLYRHGSIEVVHRVIDVWDEGGAVVLVTQGDGNNVADEPFVASDDIGRVVALVPKAGWPSIFLRDLLSG
jgi:signal peptidase